MFLVNPYIHGSGVPTYTSVYPTAYSDVYVKTNNDYGTKSYGYQSTNPANSLTGHQDYNGWVVDNASPNNRIHIDLGSPVVISRIYYENAHISGAYTDRGFRNFTFWGSNTSTAFDDTTYATDTNWTQLTISQSFLDQHTASNIADPKYITLTENTTSYRYYALKMSSDWGTSFNNYYGIRRVELQTAD